MICAASAPKSFSTLSMPMHPNATQSCKRIEIMLERLKPISCTVISAVWMSNNIGFKSNAPLLSAPLLTASSNTPLMLFMSSEVIVSFEMSCSLRNCSMISVLSLSYMMDRM